jgi:branched-chain amino acid transport system substrate-binding protein
MNKRFLLFCAALLLLIPLGACSAGSGSGGGNPKEIVLGYVGPITGPYAGLGLPIHKIAEYAVEEINKSGGINGIPVRYVYRDDTGDPTKSANYVRELVEKEGATLMLGSANSTSVAAALDFLTENKIITMLASASAVNLIDPEKYPYMFRTQVNNEIMAEGLVQSAIKGGYKSVVLVGDNGNLGTDGIAYTKKYAEQYGLTFADIVQFTPGSADMTPVAQNVARANADAVIGFATGQDAARIVAALDRVGMTGKYMYLGYMGTALANFADLAGEEATRYVTYQGLKSGSVPEDEPEPELGYAQAWYDTMIETFGDYNPDGSGRNWGWIEAGRAYDCIMLMKYAIEKAQSTDPDKVKEALETVGPEFKSVLYESGYEFGPNDHEGFNANELANCYMGRIVANVGKIKGEPVTVRATMFD